MTNEPRSRVRIFDKRTGETIRELPHQPGGFITLEQGEDAEFLPERATPDRVAVFVEECRRDPRWQEAKGEMGSIARGYYGAVEGAMEAAAEIAFDKACGVKDSERPVSATTSAHVATPPARSGSKKSGHSCPEPHSCDDDRCWP